MIQGKYNFPPRSTRTKDKDKSDIAALIATVNILKNTFLKHKCTSNPKVKVTTINHPWGPGSNHATKVEFLVWK